MTKKMASVPMKQSIPSRGRDPAAASSPGLGAGPRPPRPESRAGAGSVRSGCARSHRGRRPRTGGTRSKLCSGGGDGVAHSRVQAFHRSEEHTSELQSPCNLVCRLLLEKKNKKMNDEMT